jgi:mechanosensitive ion channel protein 1/2/3
LRVISHHRARLATPIRTVQKIYGDADIENIPYGETIYSRANPSSRPFLLIEPQTRVHTEEKPKAQNRQPSDQKPTAQPDVTTANNSVTNNSDSNNHQPEKVAATPAAAESASENAQVEGNKGKAEKVQTNPEQVKRPSFEDNIVLSMALEGSKRTLPIEEGMSTSPETNEMDKVGPAPSVKDKKGQIPAGQGKVDPEGSR